MAVSFLNTAAAAAKSLQSCPTLCDPMDYSPPGSSVHGIFQARGLKWVAIAFSKHTDICCCCCCCCMASVVSDSVRPHRWQPTRLPRPWDSPGKNTGVGCHFLLQCMKVKSESESEVVSTSSTPHGLSAPGSFTHGICQARVLEWGAIAFSKATIYRYEKSRTQLKQFSTYKLIDSLM